jgi:ribonuclease E
MKKRMLINAIDKEEKRMAVVDDGKLTDFFIQMAVKEPIAGNIYKGVVMKVERGLQAAFVDYGGRRNGFLPLHDVSPEYFTERREDESARKPILKMGQEVLVQVCREEKDRKGAMLTTYISMPGRYLVLMPKKQTLGVSRKIEDDADRKRLKEFTDQVGKEDNVGLIVRTAGLNRKKQELSRDYQHLSRLWKEILKKADETPSPALIYQESDFGVRSLRDYFTPDIQEILVDDVETFRKIRDYCKIVAPRNVNMIKLHKEKTPIFDKYRLEEQIDKVYRERVDLKSGGYIVINPTEAMITIDVNSGRGSNKRDVEETAYKTNLEAADEIARQLRLRDLGGLIVIDFIDMKDRKHNQDVEKAFKTALSLDRSRIQMSKISKFGIIELSRQKKQSTVQEISYVVCPFCKGSGMQPSLEYTALNALRRIKSEAVKGDLFEARIVLPIEAAEYLLNNKRAEIAKLEDTYDSTIHISGRPHIPWSDSKFEFTKKEEPKPAPADQEEPAKTAEVEAPVPEPAKAAHSPVRPRTQTQPQPQAQSPEEEQPSPAKHKSRRRRPRRRKKKPGTAPVEAAAASSDNGDSEPFQENRAGETPGETEARSYPVPVPIPIATVETVEPKEASETEFLWPWERERLKKN